jgi:hypothetical protein
MSSSRSGVIFNRILWFPFETDSLATIIEFKGFFILLLVKIIRKVSINAVMSNARRKKLVDDSSTKVSRSSSGKFIKREPRIRSSLEWA